MRTFLLFAIAASAAGCTIELGPERNCDDRTAWYPDDNEDGVGEPTEVYIGCDAPEGWVDNVDTAIPYTGTRRRGLGGGWRLPPGIERHP